ncbi:pyridoxal-phosphate dependent enzyme [Georgenia alba]|uniref:Pyridoxal-phosphate dependent enzyme n=1 Tax=Georgenia alba TaxID=2233858 RepID=A0ABW2Q5A8_9MICO
MTRDELTSALEAFPRLTFTHATTPLEPLPGLAAELGVPELLVKRDDLTGLAFGGSKVRALEYIVADAQSQSCDVFVAGGGVAQSNHARLCAAAAVRAGMRPVLILRRGRAGTVGGNYLITSLLGAEIEWVDDDPRITDRGATAARMHAVAEEHRRRGRRPYVLESSVHPLGVLGYLRCVLEMAEQLRARDVEKVAVFATSEGVVLTGLLLGARLLGLDWTVTGVGWRPLPEGIAERIAALAADAATLLGLTSPIRARDVVVLDHGGPDYAVASGPVWELLTRCAQVDGLLLDPVYTAKGMSGLVQDVADGNVEGGRTPVFVHTGGLPALFAHDGRGRPYGAS